MSGAFFFFFLIFQFKNVNLDKKYDVLKKRIRFAQWTLAVKACGYWYIGRRDGWGDTNELKSLFSYIILQGTFFYVFFFSIFILGENQKKFPPCVPPNVWEIEQSVLSESCSSDWQKQLSLTTLASNPHTLGGIHGGNFRKIGKVTDRHI